FGAGGAGGLFAAERTGSGAVSVRVGLKRFRSATTAYSVRAGRGRVAVCGGGGSSGTAGGGSRGPVTGRAGHTPERRTPRKAAASSRRPSATSKRRFTTDQPPDRAGGAGFPGRGGPPAGAVAGMKPLSATVAERSRVAPVGAARTLRSVSASRIGASSSRCRKVVRPRVGPA